MLYKLVAILEQVRPELAARPREIMQVVQVQETRKLRDYAARTIRVSTRR
jgi:hypothetical protein